jgi:hypothetical protein
VRRVPLNLKSILNRKSAQSNAVYGLAFPGVRQIRRGELSFHD